MTRLLAGKPTTRMSQALADPSLGHMEDAFLNHGDSETAESPPKRPTIPTSERFSIDRAHDALANTRRERHEAAAQKLVARFAELSRAADEAARVPVNVTTDEFRPWAGIIAGAAVIVTTTALVVHRIFPGAPFETIVLAMIPSFALGGLAFFASERWLRRRA